MEDPNEQKSAQQTQAQAQAPIQSTHTQEDPSSVSISGYAQHPHFPHPEYQEIGVSQQSYGHGHLTTLQDGNPDPAFQPPPVTQIAPNGNLEGHLRSLIMHHNNTSSLMPTLPLTNMPISEENENSNTQAPPHPLHPPPPHTFHPHQPLPPHFSHGGFYPPMLMHCPVPSMLYAPHYPLSYPIPFEGQTLPYPLFPMGQYPPPGYIPMPEHASAGNFMENSEAPGHHASPPSHLPRHFDRNGPRHQRQHSYPKPNPKYHGSRRQYDQQGPFPPRADGQGFQARSQQQQQQPQPLQPGLITDEFPPLGTEKPKTKPAPAPIASEQPELLEARNGSRREHGARLPTGPRYRGGQRRNLGPRRQYHDIEQQQLYEPSPDEIAILNEVIKEQVSLATPSAEELEIKHQLQHRLQRLCSKVSPTAELKGFGSLVSGFATVGSDLDLVLVDNGARIDRPYFEVPLLLEQQLKDDGLEAQLLPRTRVPILKIVQPAIGEYQAQVAADIGFANSLAITNTQMLSVYSRCDPRVKDIVRFVKRWAKKRRVNNPYKGTLSSYGYVLMIFHYLINIVQPPMLPNLQLYPIPPSTPANEITSEEGYNIWFYKDVAELERQATEGTLTTNTMDLASLLLGFFEFYANRFGWTNDVISIRTKGGSISKKDKGWITATVRVGKMETEYKDRYLFAIEDPFEINHNVSRTCNFWGVRQIREEFKRANRIMRMRDGEQALRSQLFEEPPESVNPHGHRQHRSSGTANVREESGDWGRAEKGRVGAEQPGKECAGVAAAEYEMGKLCLGV